MVGSFPRSWQLHGNWLCFQPWFSTWWLFYQSCHGNIFRLVLSWLTQQDYHCSAQPGIKKQIKFYYWCFLTNLQKVPSIVKQKEKYKQDEIDTRTSHETPNVTTPYHYLVSTRFWSQIGKFVRFFLRVGSGTRRRRVNVVSASNWRQSGGGRSSRIEESFYR